MGVVTNWGQAVLTSLGNALNLLLTFIPKLLGFLVILIIGLIIAGLIAKGITAILRKIGFDRMADRVGISRFEQRMNVKLDAAGVLGRVVYWFILLIFLIPAVNALGLTSVSNILNQIIAFIPNVFVAILVLFLGMLLATFIADIVRGAMGSTNIGNPNIFAGIARWAIIGFAALIALEQLQIAPALLDELFGAIVGATALALALAFGLGGQDTARRWLARGESTMTAAASQIQAQQQTQQAQQQMQQAARVAGQPYNPQMPPPVAAPTQPYNPQQTGAAPTQPYPQQAGAAPVQPYSPQPQQVNDGYSQPYTGNAPQPPYNQPPAR